MPSRPERGTSARGEKRASGSATFIALASAGVTCMNLVRNVALPDAGFYLWADVSRSGLDDIAFAQGLLGQYNVAVLPGSLLARESDGINPGAGRIRLALVAPADECLEAAHRIESFVRT